MTVRIRAVSSLAVVVALVAAGWFLMRGDAATSAASASPSRTWSATLAGARGQTVNFWLYGGDARINAYLDGPVTSRLQALGIKLHRVPIDDTVTAVQRLMAERRGGASTGAIDLVWVNGANFAAAKQASVRQLRGPAGRPQLRLLCGREVRAVDPYEIDRPR